MTHINRSADCGNSPKNKMAEDIAIALETGDVDFFSSVLDEGALWNNASANLTAPEAILGKLNAMPKPATVTIDRVISHGKAGAVNGVVSRGRAERRFCHVIEFTSVKCSRVRRIETY